MKALNRISWARGLLRVWLALSAAWIAGVLVLSIHAAYGVVSSVDKSSPYALAAIRMRIDADCDRAGQRNAAQCETEDSRNRAAEMHAAATSHNHSTVWSVLTNDTHVRNDMLDKLLAPFQVLIVGIAAFIAVRIALAIGAWIFRGFRSTG
jgi:hypothetical protein